MTTNQLKPEQVLTQNRTGHIWQDHYYKRIGDVFQYMGTHLVERDLHDHQPSYEFYTEDEAEWAIQHEPLEMYKTDIPVKDLEKAGLYEDYSEDYSEEHSEDTSEDTQEDPHDTFRAMMKSTLRKEEK